MKKILPLIIFLTSLSVTFAQEGTKQLMPNASDPLYIEFGVFPGSDFGLYDCAENERINVFLNEGEKMFFGMKMNEDNYGGNVFTNPDFKSFRILDPDGEIANTSTTMCIEGQVGYINNYSEAITGPNNVILNGKEITNGYSPLVLTADKTGNYRIEFQSWENNHRYNGDNEMNRQRFALEFFDVTVTDSDNNVNTNPGEPNKSAGRLWSYGWQLTNTSFTENPVNAHFYVFTSDEFINKVNFKMYPYSFIFVANRYGITPYSEQNYIRRVQSMEGDQLSGNDLSEYKIFLNDPDRSVWPNTRLAPPTVRVKAEDYLYMDYQYNRYPSYIDIERDTLTLEKNTETDCDYEDVTFFSIETNIDGYTAILIDLDGDSAYSASGSDRVIYRDLKKGLNYILWDFKTDGGAVVNNNTYTASATFFGRGAAHFPMYDVEQMDGITTSSIRPFNRLNTTIYWDDSQIGLWGDLDNLGRMDETSKKQLKISNNTPRTWIYEGDEHTNVSHNGEVNTLNTWFNAIDLGFNDIVLEVSQSDTKCLDGSAPWIGDVYKEGPKNTDLIFEAQNFDVKFSHPEGLEFQTIRITSLPAIGNLTYNNNPVNIGLEILRDNISNLRYTPPVNWIGKTPFSWEASDGTLWSNNEEAVYCIINSAPTISEIDNQVLCTNSETQPISFTVSDEDTSPEELTITGFSANPSVVPHNGINIEGTGSNRTVTITPVPYESGHAIIYLMVEDGLSQTIEEFAVTIAPSLQFSGDTSLCLGDPLYLMAEEFGAESYSWNFDGSTISQDRTVEQDPGNVNFGDWSLSIEKYIEKHDITCTSTRNFSVTYSPDTNFSGDQNVCVGEQINLVPDEVNATFEWRRDGEVITTERTFSKEASLSDNGNDYALWVNKSGCEYESDPFSLSVVVMPNTSLTTLPGQVDPGRNGSFTINNTTQDFIYRAWFEGTEIATETSTGGELTMTIPSEYLEIGENTFDLTVDNFSCEVPLTNQGIINVNEPGITVSPTTIATSEDGEAQTFTVILHTEPLNTVSINLSSEDVTEGTVSSEPLTFNAGNWDTPQTVTVTPVRDWEVDGDIDYPIVLEPAVSTDSYYTGIDPDDVTVTNTNVDAAGIEVSASELTTSETGTTASFTVILNSKPSGAVTIDITGLDTSEGSLNTDELIFSPDDWDQSQTITITGVDDAIDNGLQSYILQGTATSNDSNYEGLSISSITINNEDDDNAGLNISETSVTTYEDQTQPSATFEVSLNSEPESTVEINFTSTKSTEGQVASSSQSLTFNNTNWSTAQIVTINGVDDAIDDGDQPYTISIATIASEINYNGLSASVDATNMDDDDVGITVSTNTIETSEDGTTADFSVQLNSEPVADITIDITSSDTEAEESTISHQELVFTPSNWNTAQTVTVTGVDDHIIDGDQNYTITLTVISGSSDYVSLDDVTITATNLHNDVAEIWLSGTNLETSEDLTSDSFELRLTAQPESDVNLEITGLDESEGSLSATSLLFSPANWNVSQQITVTGINDAIADGNISYSLTATSSSSYAPFNNITSDAVEVTNLDNNSAGINVSPTDINLNEGETGSFSISLNSQPTADVTISISSPDPNEVALSQSSVTFTPADWASKTINVNAIDDAIDDGDNTYIITLSNTVSSDYNYGGMTIDDVTVNITDIHTAGITVSGTSGNTTEAGGTATFEVMLMSKPTADVEVSATSDDATEGQTTVSPLIFTSSNWNTPQTITIAGQDDDIDDGNQNYHIDVQVSSTDSNYGSSFNTSVSLSNEDDDTAGLTITENTPFGTTEAGGTASFTVRLDSEPVEPVTIKPASNMPTEGQVTEGNNLTFNSSNWNTPQTVTVTGQDDDIADGNQEYQINVSLSSYDNNYGSALNTSLTLINEDDDAAGVTISPVSSTSDRLETSEAGGTATFTIVLNSQPTHQVAFSFISDDTNEGTVTPGVTFSASDWNTPKTITVTGVNDNVDDEDQDYAVNITTSSSDENYDQVAIDDVYLTNMDNDEAGLILSKTSFETSEPDVADQMSVRLQSEPVEEVSIRFESSNETEGTVSPATLTFNAGNWDANQEITITGQDDAVMDGNIPYTISISASSGDANYNNLADQTLSVINNDNDLVGINVNPKAGLYTTEAGATASFTVTLDSEPTAAVSISLSSADITEGIITSVSRGTVDTDANSATITFQPTEWNNAIEVTVTGIDDDIDDSDVAYSIICENAISADGNYNGLNVSNVSLTNQDNDAYGTTVTPQDIILEENGGAQNFTIVLKSRPTTAVTYNLTAETNGRATVTPATVTFTTAGNDWVSPKEVNLTPVDNDFVDGNFTFSIIPGKGVTDDINYKNHSTASVTVAIVDDDQADIDISEISGPTSEDGGESSFSIGLKSAPVEQVLFEMSSSDTSEGKITAFSNGRGSFEGENKAFVTYDQNNWSEPVTITVTGQQDDLADGNQTYYVNFEPIIGGTSQYTGIRPDTVEMVNQDNNTAGYTINPLNGLEINEAGEHTVFNISLNTMPEGNVVIHLFSTLPDEGIITEVTEGRGSANKAENNATVRFSEDNWNSPVTVNVTGVDDNEQDGYQTFDIITEYNDSETEDEYYKIEIPDVSVTNLDDFTPRPQNDMADTDQETAVTIDVLANDPGLDYGATVTITSEPAQGETIVNPDNTVTYAPDRLYYGEFSFEYTVTNSLDNVAHANVTVNVEHINVTPVAHDDFRGTSINTPVEVDVLMNDENLFDAPIHISIVDASYPDGEMVVTEQNTITFTPVQNFTGLTSFSYRVTDNEGDSGEATVTINVREENHTPMATDDEAIVYKNNAADINVLDNDNGLNDGLATFSIFAQPTNGTTAINNNRTIHYIPDTDFTGNDLMLYLIEDVDGDYDLGVLSIQVSEMPNAVPVANDVAVATEYETPVNINILFNDTGLDDGVESITLSPKPANGTAQVNHDFSVTYNPGSAFSGTESFGYQVCDNNGDCSSANIRVNVLPQETDNHIPDARDDQATTYLNTPVTIDILANDNGLEDGFGNINIPAAPISGSAQINNAHTITFDPGYYFVGQISFSYLISDEDGDWDMAMVTVNVVEEENIIPSATGDEASVVENSSVNIDVLANDSGLDDTPVAVSVNQEATHGSLTIENNQTITYTPDNDYFGSDSFGYTVADANGDSDSATVNVNVQADTTNDDGDDNSDDGDDDGDGGDDSNDDGNEDDGNQNDDDETDTNHQPVASDDEALTDENTPVNVQVLSNDTELEDEPVVVTISALSENGNTEVMEDNTITFTPDQNFTGETSFSYRIADADGDSDIATVTITVSKNNNTVPVTEDDYATTVVNTPVIIDVLANDTGIEDLPITLTVSKSANGGTMVIEENNTITFTPAGDSMGQISFTYAVTDSNGDQSVATVRVEILPGITAINDTIESEMNQTINIHPIDNDQGIKDDVFVTILQHPENGNAVMDDSGIVTYDPHFDFVGTDSISYEVCSEANINNCSQAWAIINIRRPEIETDEEFRIPEGFSPDGDGVNDYFEMRGINKYERVTISIFNRWGNLIYASDNYQNNWDGTSRKTLGSSGSLPTGTYFYVIKIVDNDKQYKGNVFLKK
jgi:gliding motility-associated-like protein